MAVRPVTIRFAGDGARDARLAFGNGSKRLMEVRRGWTMRAE